MEHIRYRTLPSGLKQRIYEKNETPNERNERLAELRRERRVAYHNAPPRRPSNTPESMPEGRVIFEYEPGEEDRSSSEYRIRLLCRGIRQLNRIEPYDDDLDWY